VVHKYNHSAPSRSDLCVTWSRSPARQQTGTIYLASDTRPRPACCLPGASLAAAFAETAQEILLPRPRWEKRGHAGVEYCCRFAAADRRRIVSDEEAKLFGFDHARCMYKRKKPVNSQRPTSLQVLNIKTRASGTPSHSSYHLSSFPRAAPFSLAVLPNPASQNLGETKGSACCVMSRKSSFGQRRLPLLSPSLRLHPRSLPSFLGLSRVGTAGYCCGVAVRRLG